MLGSLIRPNRKAANPDPILIENDQGTVLKVIRNVVEIGNDQGGDLAGSALTLSSEQKNRRSTRIRVSEEFAEVGISRYEHASGRLAGGKDPVVRGCSEVHVAQVKSVVPGVGE